MLWELSSEYAEALGHMPTTHTMISLSESLEIVYTQWTDGSDTTARPLHINNENIF